MTEVENNGTNPLAQAKALIAEEQQTRINNVMAALEANRVECRAIIQTGEDQYRLLSSVADLPVIVQLVAK